MKPQSSKTPSIQLIERDVITEIRVPDRRGRMFIMHVFVQVKEDKVEAFKAVTTENARNSVQEPGIARFDVVQQADDPTRFVLIEVYRTQEDPAKHKETPHYKAWREAAEPMMAGARSRIIYANVFPDDNGWG